MSEVKEQNMEVGGKKTYRLTGNKAKKSAKKQIHEIHLKHKW